MNHQQELYELYHLINEFLMDDIYFYIQDYPIEIKINFEKKKIIINHTPVFNG